MLELYVLLNIQYLYLNIKQKVRQVPTEAFQSNSLSFCVTNTNQTKATVLVISCLLLIVKLFISNYFLVKSLD